MGPYWSSDDGTVALYHGDSREVLPDLGLTADLIVTDPPYGETSLAWDRWPDGWPAVAAQHARSMWCFGSLRMYFARLAEFTAWRMSQDVVWEKPNGSGFAADRFKRVHENVLHWYRGDWRSVHHETPRVEVAHRTQGNSRRRHDRPDHFTGGDRPAVSWSDDGTRLVRSVIKMPTLWRRGAVHPTEKPVELLDPLIRYGCPPGGLVLDLFAGSGSTLDAARQAGRRAVGIEADERYCEVAARRLSAGVLDFEQGAAL